MGSADCGVVGRKASTGGEDGEREAMVVWVRKYKMGQQQKHAARVSFVSRRFVQLARCADCQLSTRPTHTNLWVYNQGTLRNKDTNLTALGRGNSVQEKEISTLTAPLAGLHIDGVDDPIEP
jgi:hypothetical protein